MIAELTSAAQALAIEALAAAGVDPARIAWDNRPTDPPAGDAPWAVVTLTPGATLPYADGLGSLDTLTALAQVTLQFMPNTGTGETERLVAALETTYRAGRVVALRDSGNRPVARVRCAGFAPGPVVRNTPGNWSACPCRATLSAVAWRAGLATDPPLAVRLPAA